MKSTEHASDVFTSPGMMKAVWFSWVRSQIFLALIKGKGENAMCDLRVFSALHFSHRADPFSNNFAIKILFFFRFQMAQRLNSICVPNFFMTQKLKFCSFDCLAMCGGWFTNYFNARVSNWVSWNAKLLSRDWDQVMSLLNHQLELPYAQICRNLRFEIFFFSPTF